MWYVIWSSKVSFFFVSPGAHYGKKSRKMGSSGNFSHKVMGRSPIPNKKWQNNGGRPLFPAIISNKKLTVLTFISYSYFLWISRKSCIPKIFWWSSIIIYTKGRDVITPKIDVYFGNFPNGLDPTTSFYQNMLQIFSRLSTFAFCSESSWEYIWLFCWLMGGK